MGGQAEPFKAVLTPHRSLGPSGFLLLMAGLSLVSFITGVAFLLKGAWPVLGFFGLDVLIIYVAFRLNYRSGRLYETVEINDGKLTLTRVHPSGQAEQFNFNPYWTRVELAEGRDGRTSLSLRHHEKMIWFGRFLNDDERREVAHMLRQALIDARDGVQF
ncbi:MAG: DUF2244 domain-containing protein [Hyphomicrobiaceae bacterium]